MKIGLLLSLIAICIIVVSGLPSKDQVRKFPDDFLFGASTAAYQIEGGWDADGKGESIWDHAVHTDPEFVSDLSNGDVAVDSYHQYKRDVEKVREMSLDMYRFSIAWPRILPTGMSNNINEAGIAYYNHLINELLKYNIVPMVTMYHWDLPQKLQELGGFANPLLADWFEDYARVLFETFGDRVRNWITFNEPRELCEGYDSKMNAPRLNASGIGGYLCAKHVLIGHAKAYHLYNKEFRDTQKGNVGITISINWLGAASEADEYAAEITRQSNWGLWAEPIFGSEGGFPKELSERIAEKSKSQGYKESRLPSLTEEEKVLIKGASDFFGINHYTSELVTSADANLVSPSALDDAGFERYQPEDWPAAATDWLKRAPNSLYNVLTHVHSKYPSAVYYITENGWSNHPGESLEDDERVAYYRAAWENVLDALDAGVNLKGYMAWSLLDNFEWIFGYSKCFGLYAIDFEDPARPATAKKSALVYKDLIKKRYIDYEYEPEDLTMTIDEGH